MKKKLGIFWGKLKRYIPLYLFLAAVILNIAAWNSAPFSDFYVTHIFPIWVETYSRLTGLVPFSIGEWMLVAAVFLTVVLLGGGMICVVRRRLSAWYRRYANSCAWIAAIASLVMTLNCFILYHCSTISQQYSLGTGRSGQGVTEITALRDYVVVQANTLAEQMERDEKGYIIYQGDLPEQARQEMSRLGAVYGRLAGYYPRPKAFWSSDFFSQQYIMGYYFPFSMEANYNKSMYLTNMPVTLCHELSHLKGFIYEDEANFIGYLACVDSSIPLFRYSAYLSVLQYVDRDFYEAIGENKKEYLQHPAISDQVRKDDMFLTREAWDQVEQNAWLDTKIVQEVSSNIVETNLTLNGVSDGIISYSRVVDLLLQYYDGILYE